MALADTAAQFAESRQGPQCGIGYIVERLSTEDKTLLDTWLFPPHGSPRPPAKWIATVLSADGHTTSYGKPPSDQVVSHHRQKNCGCFR